MGARERRQTAQTTRCPCGKVAFRTYEEALGAAHRRISTDVKRAYWCPASGKWHITGATKREVERERMLKLQERNRNARDDR